MWRYHRMHTVTSPHAAAKLLGFWGVPTISLKTIIISPERESLLLLLSSLPTFFLLNLLFMLYAFFKVSVELFRVNREVNCCSLGNVWVRVRHADGYSLSTLLLFFQSCSFHITQMVMLSQFHPLLYLSMKSFTLTLLNNRFNYHRRIDFSYTRVWVFWNKQCLHRSLWDFYHSKYSLRNGYTMMRSEMFTALAH